MGDPDSKTHIYRERDVLIPEIDTTLFANITLLFSFSVGVVGTIFANKSELQMLVYRGHFTQPTDKFKLSPSSN